MQDSDDPALDRPGQSREDDHSRGDPTAELKDEVKRLRQQFLARDADHVRLVNRLRSDLNEYAERLTEAQELAEIGAVAAGVAHDYNNYSAVILGYLDLALRDKSISPTVRERLKLVRDNAARASKLSNRLLSLLRGAETGGPVPVDLNHIVQELTPILAFELNSCGIRIEERLASDLPPCLASEHELGRVLLNLMTNAKHAMLLSETRQLCVETAYEDDHVRLRVKDTGHGIPREALEKVFHAYYSTKGTRAPKDSPLAKVKSTGLGLSTCRAIVESMGGSIAVESEVGKGSTFTVSFPAALGRPSPALTRENMERGARREPRVLVVEDDQTQRLVMTKKLERNGYSVIQCADGQEALETLRSGNRVDLIITDMMMPRLSGTQFVRIVRGDLALGTVPILVISAVAQGPEVEDLTRLGATQFLRKPVALETLAETVDGLLQTEP